MASKTHMTGYAAYGAPRPVKQPFNSDQNAFSDITPTLEQRLHLLNIPYNEATHSVRKAVSALYGKLDELAFELDATRERLQDTEKLVNVNPLTGLPNRIALFEKLQWAVSMNERYQHHFSLISFDINNLTSLNERFGNAAGDMAIRHTARMLNEAKRDTDFLARIGSDEFVMLLHYADEEAALRRARTISQKLMSSHFVFNGQPLSVSAACGVYHFQQGDDGDTALRRADRAMHADKKSYKDVTHQRFQA